MVPISSFCSLWLPLHGGVIHRKLAPNRCWYSFTELRMENWVIFGRKESHTKIQYLIGAEGTYQQTILEFAVTTDYKYNILNFQSLSLNMKLNIQFLNAKCNFTLFTTVCIVWGVTSHSLTSMLEYLTRKQGYDCLKRICNHLNQLQLRIWNWNYSIMQAMPPI